MKDTEVHQGLEGKEMRDFYQETLNSYYAKELSISKRREADNLEIYRRTDFSNDKKFGSIKRRIKLSEIEFKYAQENLKLAEYRLGLLQTMDGLNWREHDMSEYVPCSGEHYRSFIGTDEEYAKFIEQFSK